MNSEDSSSKTARNIEVIMKLNNTPTPEQIARLPKWAQEERAQREKELREAKSLRWPLAPEPVPRDMWAEWLARPSGSKGVITGWRCHTYDMNYRVSMGCSCWVDHSPDNATKTSTQGPGMFFHTKLEALMSVRWRMTRRVAEALAQVDSDIAAAYSELQSEPSA